MIDVVPDIELIIEGQNNIRYRGACFKIEYDIGYDVGSTEIWRGKVLPWRHIHMLISNSRLPFPLLGLDSVAASFWILPLKQCLIVLFLFR